MKKLAQAAKVNEERVEKIIKGARPFNRILTRFGEIVRRPEKATTYQSILLVDKGIIHCEDKSYMEFP